MKLFNKKTQPTTGCCCNANCTPETMKDAEDLKGAPGIIILGSGCAKCNALEKATQVALEQLHSNETILHITDFAKIAAYGVMSTPALVVDGKVVSYGKVLKVEEIIEILNKVRG